MSTCDVVNQVGGAPANFLDIGGGANAEVMANALEVINSDPNVRAIFINIFGGITRGEEVANGIVQALERVAIGAPMVIRLDGTNAEEGRAHPEDGRVGPGDLLADHAGCGPQGRRAGAGGGVKCAIFVDENTKVVVQGLTGGQGRFHGLRNRAYGTQVVAGVTPGKGGQDVEGIPVFDTVAEAVAATGANASFVSVPPEGARRRHPGGGRGRRAVRGVHHRGHPGPRRGPGLQHPGRHATPAPGCSGPTARASSARASATSASPPARSPCPAARSAS